MNLKIANALDLPEGFLLSKAGYHAEEKKC